MKCQHCNENEAVNTFWVSFPGGRQEIHLCENCTRMAQQYYELVQRSNPGIFGGKGQLNTRESSLHIPEDAGDEVRQRRRMNILRAKLSSAVKQERYEEAACLRDEIAALKKDVVSI